MPSKWAQSVADFQKLCVAVRVTTVERVHPTSSDSAPHREAMEFLLTDEELKKVEKLLPTIAKKHGLQCSLLECSKGTPSCKSSKSGKGVET